MYMELEVHCTLYKTQTNADFIFQKLIVFVTLVDFIVKILLKICRFQNRCSSVMEEILVVMHRDWWDKAYTA